MAHGDGDGVCACAITYMALDGEAYVVFAEPYNVDEVLNDMLESGQFADVDNLYIVDIAYHKHISGLLDGLSEGGVHITYIDHHPSSRAIADRYDGLVESNGQSASTLASVYFGIPTNLSKIGGVCDKVTLVTRREPIREEAHMLNRALSHHPHDTFKYRVMKRLADGDMPTDIDFVVERARQGREKLEEMLDGIGDYIIHEDKYVTILDIRDVQTRGCSGAVAQHVAVDRHKVAYVIHTNTETEDVVFTGRTHRDIPVIIGWVMKECFEGGGGHKNAGSGGIPVEDYNHVATIGHIVRLTYKSIDRGRQVE